MKKLIIGLSLVLMVSMPVAVSAETIMTQMEMRQQLIVLITQLIQVLQQQLNALIAQESQKAQEPSLTPTPVETTPTGPITTPGAQPNNVVPTKMPTTIQIFNPYPDKGLGRTYRASDKATDESNYIEVGAIVRDENGNYMKDVVVEVTATDSIQNKTLKGTGDVRKVWKNGIPETVHYYHYYYEFKTSGQHTITFTADGVSESVELSVGEAIPQ